MRSADIAAYFLRKIAKPILFDYRLDDDHRFYAIEPTAVVDNVLHVMVLLKYDMFFGEKRKLEHFRGDAAIPLRDGDTIQSIFEMAIAAADFRAASTETYSRGPDNQRIMRAYAEYLDRSETQPPGLRM